MVDLDDVTVEELQDALDAVEGKKPVQRLLAAIAYKHGASQTELAAWHDVERRTIYGWLARFDTDEPLAGAATDDPRSGRPGKLDDNERAALRRTLRNSPAAAGYAASAWTTALLQQHLDETYDVTYSMPSCRRLLRDAGLQYRRSPSTAADAVDADGSSDERDERGGVWVLE